LSVLTEQGDTSRAMIAIQNIEKINSIELHDIEMVSTVRCSERSKLDKLENSTMQASKRGKRGIDFHVKSRIDFRNLSMTDLNQQDLKLLKI